MMERAQLLPGSASSELEAAHEKAWATAVARGALRGFEIVRMHDGGAVASKYGMLRSLSSLADVEAFLQVVGA